MPSKKNMHTSFTTFSRSRARLAAKSWPPKLAPLSRAVHSRASSAELKVTKALSSVPAAVGSKRKSKETDQAAEEVASGKKQKRLDDCHEVVITPRTDDVMKGKTRTKAKAKPKAEAAPAE